MVKVLHNSAAVRKAITDIFRTSGKRVAISAFVGNSAEAFLPNPKGIRLICWPKAGGTNPDALRRLKSLGVNVQFADDVHMKVYWSKKGAVVTSANLSTNALGAGNLKEFGVLLPASEIDIEAVVKTLRARSFDGKELKELDRKSEKTARLFHDQGMLMTYLDWHSLPAKGAWKRREWKIGWVSELQDFSQESKRVARDEFRVRQPQAAITGRKMSYREGDYILFFSGNPRTNRHGSLIGSMPTESSKWARETRPTTPTTPTRRSRCSQIESTSRPSPLTERSRRRSSRR
jgi:hypothetical protein